MLPTDPMGHLLAAAALRFCDAEGRKRREAVWHACAHKSLDTRDRASSDCLSRAPRRLHVEFPCRRKSHDVGC